jgi:hypothetical protein
MWSVMMNPNMPPKAPEQKTAPYVNTKQNYGKNATSQQPKNMCFVGTQTGTCPICKETKQLLFLKYGFTLCEDCLHVCISILDYLQQQEKLGTSVTSPKNCKNENKPTPKTVHQKLPQKTLNHEA